MLVRLNNQELGEAVVEYLKKRGAVLKGAKWGVINFVEDGKAQWGVEISGVEFPVNNGPYR